MVAARLVLSALAPQSAMDAVAAAKIAPAVGEGEAKIIARWTCSRLIWLRKSDA